MQKSINQFKTTRGEEVQVYPFVDGIVCMVNTSKQTIKYIAEKAISAETQVILDNLHISVD